MTNRIAQLQKKTLHILKPKKASRLLSAFIVPDSNGVTGIDRLDSELSKTCRAAEPGFLSLGKELQEVYAETQDLSRHIDYCVELVAGDNGGGVLEQIRNHVHDSLEQVRRFQSQAWESLERIGTVAEHLETLGRLCEKIDRSGLFYKIIGLNMDIESRQAGETHRMFSIVAHQVKNLSGKVIELAGEIQQGAKTARNAQLQAHQEIQNGLKALNEVVRENEETVTAALADIEALVDRLCTILDKNADHSRTIEKHVGKVVVGIQLQDSISQRIEHIHHALEDVLDLCTSTEPEPDSSNHNQEERFGFAHTITEIQKDQLHRIIAEIRDVHQTTEKAFEEVMGEIKSAMKTLSSLGSGADDVENHNARIQIDPFVGLRSELSHLHRLIGANTTLTERIEKAGTYASEMTRKLTDKIEHVVDMNRDTHHMSLNAIIKSAHIGESGKTLEVLARELTDLARNSNVFADNVKAVLIGIGTDTTICPQGMEQKTADKHFDTMVLGKDLDDITEAYERINESSILVQQKVSALEQRLAGINDLLHFLPGFAVGLEAHLSTLSNLSEEFAPWAGKITSGNAVGCLGALAERYTMDQERDIHNKIMSVDTAHADLDVVEFSSSQSGRIDESGDEDKLGDNVDLF